MTSYIWDGVKWVLRSKAPEPVPSEPTTSITADPDANAATVERKNWLNSLVGASSNRVLMGQHIGNHAESQAALQDWLNKFNTATSDPTTSRWPAVVSCDYDARSSNTVPNYSTLNSILKTQYDAGALILIGAHMLNPSSLLAYNKDKNVDMTKVTDVNDPLYQSWVTNCLKHYADGLLDLQSKGVSVIWRYPHEPDNSSWWWCYLNDSGTWTQALYKKLCQLIYDYFRSRGIHNVLYLYHCHISGINEHRGKPCHPGASYVDLIGMSNYRADLMDSTHENRVDTFHADFPLTPFLFSESGTNQSTLPQFDALNELEWYKSSTGRFPYCIGSIRWHNGHAWHQHPNALAFAQHSLVVTRDKVLTPPKGESGTSTVESRLLSDPDVLFVGTFDSADWVKAWGVTVTDFSENELVGTFAGVTETKQGKALRVKTPANVRYGNHRIANLTSIGVPEVEEAYLRYRVFMGADFDWQRAGSDVHGKLPGLGGKFQTPDWALPGGGKRYNGNTALTTLETIDDADCFSARLMFHHGKGLKDYLYVPSPYGTVNSSGVYGSHEWALDSNGNKLTFNVGEWNTVEQRVKMNTPGVADGLHEVWLNGVKGISRKVMWRAAGKGALKINRIWLTWFYGGGSSDFPDTDSFVYFDDFVLSKSYIGPRSD